MRILLQGADTNSVKLDQWVVLNEDGSVVGHILEDTLNEDGAIVLTMTSGKIISKPVSESGDFEIFKQLIAEGLGTQDFDLVVRPISTSVK